MYKVALHDTGADGLWRYYLNSQSVECENIHYSPCTKSQSTLCNWVFHHQVFTGLLRVQHRGLHSKDDTIHLLCHELLRVFNDRCLPQNRNKFLEILSEALRIYFKVMYNRYTRTVFIKMDRNVSLTLYNTQNCVYNPLLREKSGGIYSQTQAVMIVLHMNQISP